MELENYPVDRISSWILRLELENDSLRDQRIFVSEIAAIIRAKFGDDLTIFSDDNADLLVLRMRLVWNTRGRSKGEDVLNGRIDLLAPLRIGSSKDASSRN